MTTRGIVPRGWRASANEERAKDGPLLTCPWCAASLRDTISSMQITHLIQCGDAARAEQREASAGLIYGLAHSMAARGLFVRDDFGEPNIHAIHEIEAAIRAQGESLWGGVYKNIAAAIRSAGK